MAGRVRRLLRSARAAVNDWMHRVWAGDRTRLRGWPSLRCRLLRIATWTAAGFVRHSLSLRSIALTYYSVFSIVPLLAVVLWMAKAFDWFSILDVGGRAAGPLLNENPPLAHAIDTIGRVVSRVDLLGGGLIGLGALLYAVARLFAHVEGTVDTIAGARTRPLLARRLLGYVVLLVMPAMLTATVGVVGSLLVAPLRTAVTRAVGGLEIVEVVVAGLAVVAAIALALAVLYGAAARARVPFRSALVGGIVGACLVLATMWAFAAFQIGVSRRNGVTSGIAAIPVLLLWIHTSWLMVLIGAEVAVGHAVERIVQSGVAVLIPDASARQIIGALVMAEAARVSRQDTTAPRWLGADAMARDLRVLPQTVRSVADQLVERGLLARGATGYALRGDADEVRLSEVVDALARDPARADGRAALLDQLGPEARASLAAAGGAGVVTPGDMTLRQLADGA